jgi:putative transposase
MRPARETVRRSGQTYFVSSQTFDRQPFFRHERWAALMQEVLQHYRGNSYQLHAYVVMPDHFHAILSPQDSIERAMQNNKGGFSFRARQAFNWKHNIWQAGFSDHRIRDAADWERHIAYMRHNPVKNKLCSSSDDYRYLAVNLDPIPQRLKPLLSVRSNGGAKTPPLQGSAPHLQGSTPHLQEPLPRGLSNPAKPKAPQSATVEVSPLVSASRMEK